MLVGGPQVDMFEQVSSDDYQMPVAGGWVGYKVAMSGRGGV